MDLKNYLKEHPSIKLAALAKILWPNNKSPKAFLSKVLANKNDLTPEMENRIRDAMQQLGHDIIKESKQKYFPDKPTPPKQ